MGQIEESSFTKLLFDIGRKETNCFEGHNVLYAENLIETDCRRHIMKWVYHALVNNNKVKSIEELEEEQKNELWLFVKEMCAGKTDDIVKMKEICMVFYTLEYFLNEKYKK